MSSRKAFEMKNISTSIGSAFFSEGEGVDVILKIFNYVFELFRGKNHIRHKVLLQAEYFHMSSIMSQGGL